MKTRLFIPLILVAILIAIIGSVRLRAQDGSDVVADRILHTMGKMRLFDWSLLTSQLCRRRFVIGGGIAVSAAIEKPRAGRNAIPTYAPAAACRSYDRISVTADCRPPWVVV